MDYDIRSERTAAYDDREDDPRSTRTDKRRDDDSRTERSSKHRERSASRDRKRDRDDTEREHKKKGKKDTKDTKDVKERRDKDESSKKSSHKSRARTSSRASDTIVDEPVRSRGGDSLQRGDSYTSQTTYLPYRAPTGSAPTTPGHEGLDAHVGGQFPGQNPAQYTGAYRPPLGEATSYYGDHGESVQYQPGVRLEDPDMLINAHTHLITPSAVPKPPEETGHGSAADFYSGNFDVDVGEGAPAKPPRPESMPGSFEPDERPKPSRKTSKTEKMQKMSSAASAAGSAALGYALGRNSSHHQSGSTHVTSSFEEHTENNTSQSGNHSGKYSASYSMPPGDDYVPAASQSSKPGEPYASQSVKPGYSQSYSMPPSGDYIPAASQSSKPGYSQSYSMSQGGDYAGTQSNKPGKSSHSKAGLYAGAAGLAAGYGLHKLHSSHDDTPALPPRPSQNYSGSQAHGYAALGMQHKQTGPVSKFVDWWKDHEDVRKMEEYTEYIGVCRDCFDPREPPSMAPRKHHYHHHHKRRSNGSLRSNRVDKESRYHYSSSEDDGRRNSNSWVAKGLAGYGLAKVGKALWWQNQDFDDTHSAKSGRRVRSSRSSVGRRSRSGSRDRTSVTSRGVIRHRSNSRDSRAGRHYSRTTRDYKTVHHHDRSRSRSRDTKSRLFSAAAGAALGASLVGRSKERSRSRSKSPSREYVIKKSYVEKPRSSGSALGVEDARQFSSRHSTTSSYAENQSHRISTQGSNGVFGMFSSATSTNERKKAHAKKKKGFFTFANGSSSSTDSGLVYGSPELRRRSSDLRRKGSHKKRRNSDDKLNTTLLGLGATAAALAAVQGRREEKAHSKGRPGPEVFAVRESKDRRRREKRQHIPGAYDMSSEDDEWEEVSDAESSSASVDTGLAFGDYAHSIKSRKSVESLRSDASGTNKWDWRWGREKDKRKRTSTESLKNGVHIDDRNSVSSVPTLQTVYPVPTSDPTLFDAARCSTSIPSTPQPPYGHPLITSRPEPVPLQQPQPIMPVSNSIYTSQAPAPSYVAPSGPPVFSSSRPPMPTFRNSSEYFRAEERPLSSPRREEPSTPTSSWKRDATIAGIAAATGAAIATAHSHASSKAGSSSPSQSTASRRVSSPSSVRFDLTKEQEEKEDRQRRKDLRKRDEERAERDRLRRLEDEARVREAMKREEAERLAAIKRDAEEAQARAREQREQEARSYAESEMERETRRIQREREVMARRAAEAERVAREEAERLRQQSEAATRQRERLEREILEADLRREHERAEAERKSSEFEYDVESRERQLEQREANIVEPEKYSSWKEPVAAAGIAAGAAAVAAGLAHRHKEDQEKEPRDESARVGRVQFDDDHIYEEPVFDPDYFRKKDQARPSSRDRESDIARKAASKVLADSFDDSSSKVFEDFEERYSEPRRKQSMAEFFSPSELSDRKNSISRDYFGPNADADVETSYNVPRIVTVEPPYAPEYSFTATHDPDEAHKYNGIPRLNLIEPTPPVSVASSIRGDRSHPTSPSIPAHQDPIKPVEEHQIDPADDKQPKRPGVTWGVDETRYFDAPTPDNVREQFMSDQDLRKNALEEWTRQKELEQHEQQLHDEIVVEHDSPGSSSKRTAYRVSPERSYAEAELPPKPELDRKPKSRSSDDDSPIEEIQRFEDDGRPTVDATSPERTPVILSPSEERRQFYQSPFFETVSDFTTAFDVSPGESTSGLVEELESDERPDASDRGMPGAWGFQEEDVASNPFSDTRAVVEELPSPTESLRAAKDPELQPKVEEVEDQAFEKPLSKREQRKKDKAAKRGSISRDDISSVASTPRDEPNPEELWEDTSTSKSKKKKKMNRESFGLDTESASASVASTPAAEEPAAEDLWEAPLSKKDKRKKKEREREEKRKERDREPTDVQPSTTTTSGSQTPSASGLETAADAAKGLGYAAAAGVLADAITGSRHKDKHPEEPRGREQEPRQPPYPTEDPHVPFTQPSGTYGSDGEHTPSGTFTSTAPYIPSRAFDDIEELADAKKPSKKGGRRSKYGSPSPGSPLRTEVAFDDYVGMDAAAAATAALPRGSSAAAYQTSDYADAINAPLPKDDASTSSRESEKDARRKRQYIFDEPEESGVPLAAWQEEDEDKFERTTFSDREERGKYRRGSRQESEGGSREREARSTTSDDRAFDEEGRRKHRHHRRRESERSDSTRDADTRSVVSEGRYDEEGHRKHKHRKHRSSGVDKDDVGVIAAEFRDDEDDDRRRHKHKKRVEIEPTIPERPRSDPGVGVERDGEERRKHKRRSKREGERDDDASSVVSGPAKYSEKDKDKRSSLFSSLFGRSSKESVVSRESKDDRSIDDDEERKHRRRKHRSSTLPSSYGSDDDGVSTTSRRSSRREKTARDDSGMDYSSRKHEHDKVFDNNPSRVSASSFSAVGNGSMYPALPGSFPIEEDGFGHIYEIKDHRSSSPLSYIDEAVPDILSTCKQIYTTTGPAATAAAPSVADDQFRDPIAVTSSSQPESFLSLRARGPEATATASASLTSPPLPTPSTDIPTSLEQHAQQPPPPVSATAHHQHAPSTAASLLSLGNENDPEFDEAIPIFTTLPPSRPESPTDVDEERTASPPPCLGINTRALKQHGEAIGSPTGMRSPSATAIPLRFRMGAVRSVSGSAGASGVQSPVASAESLPLSHSGAPAMMLGKWDDEHYQHQQHFGSGVLSPSSPSPLEEQQQRYYAQQASPWQHDVAASSPTTAVTPVQSRHATASPMPSPTAIPNPFFRPRPASSMQSMHKKTPSAGVVSTGKEFRPLYLVESVRGRSKSSPVGIRGKDRWTEEAWAEGHGEMGDEIAVEDLPALPGSRRGSEASVQSKRSAYGGREGGDSDDAVKPEMMETTREPSETTAPASTTSTNVFDFLVQDDEDQDLTTTAAVAPEPAPEPVPSAKASSSRSSSKAPSVKTSSPASSLFGGLLSRSSSKKSKKGKKAKKLGTVSPPRSSSPPQRDPEQDLAWRERDTADAVAGWFEGGDDNASANPADDVAAGLVEADRPTKEEETVPREVQVPPALLARDGKGKGKSKSKSKSSKTKAKKGKDKGKSEASTDLEVGDSNLSETPTPANDEAQEPLLTRPQEIISRNSGFDRDVDRDLWREELDQEQLRHGDEVPPTRSPHVPEVSNDMQQADAPRELGIPSDEAVQARVGQESGPPEGLTVRSTTPPQSRYPVPPELAAYLEPDDEHDFPASAPVPEPASKSVPDVVESDTNRPAEEQLESPKNRHKSGDVSVDWLGIAGAAAATAALVAEQEHGGQQKSASSPTAEEQIKDQPPPLAEPTAPADDESDDLNPVLAPARVSKKDKRKAKKKKKMLGLDIDTPTPRSASPAPAPDHHKGQEQEAAESFFPESKPVPAVSREEIKEIGNATASPALRDDGKMDQPQFEPAGVSEGLDEAPPQFVKPWLHEEPGPSLGQIPEEPPIPSEDRAAKSQEASEPHYATQVQTQPLPEAGLERGTPRYDVDDVKAEGHDNERSIPVAPQHDVVTEPASSFPLPVSPPSSPPSLPITSAVMESIFSATERGPSPRGLADFDESEELGRDNVANMPLPELGEDEVKVGTAKPIMEKSTSDKPNKIPIPSTYLAEPIVQEPSSIGQSTPSSGSIDTPPANSTNTPPAMTLGKKGKKRSSSVAQVTAAPSAPLPTLATPPPVQKARKRAEPKAREEFIPSLEDVAGPPAPTSEPAAARSLPLPGDDEQGAISKPEPVAARSLPLPGDDEEGATSTPEPEMLESGVNTPPLHDVFEMGQAVQIEVTSPTEKPTPVEVGQASPVLVRAERPVPVEIESQRGDDDAIAREPVLEDAGLEEDMRKENKGDQDVVAAKEQLEALGVGAPLEVVMEDLAEANVEKEQESEKKQSEAAPRRKIDLNKELPPIPVGQPDEPEEAGEDEWAMPSKKKGKKVKGKKGKRTSIPSTPQEKELEYEAPVPVPSNEPSQESTAAPPTEQIREQTIVEDASVTASAAPEEAGEDEWAVPVSKKSKKGKKAKRVSVPSSPPPEPVGESIDSVEPVQGPPFDELTERPSAAPETEPPTEHPPEQSIAQQAREVDIPSAAPTETTGEDEWSLPSAKKKGKKAKKGKRLSMPGSPAPEPVQSERAPEVLAPVKDSALDKQAEEQVPSQSTVAPVSVDFPTQPIIDDASVAPDAAGFEAGDDEWAVPVRKKSKKGKKGKSVEVPSSTPTEPGTSIDPESTAEPAAEPFLSKEHDIETEDFGAVEAPAVVSQSIEGDAGEPNAAHALAAQEVLQEVPAAPSQPEEAGEDEWALSSGKKKGKKGKKGKRASLPMSPLAAPEPESTISPIPEPFTSTQDQDIQVEESAPVGQESERPGDLFASSQEKFPAEAGEDEWAMPSKKKKGKKGKRVSLPSSPAPESGPAIDSLPVEISQESPTRGDVNLEPSVAESTMETGARTIEPSLPPAVEAGEDEWSVPVKKKGKKGKKSSLPITPMEPTSETLASQATSQFLDESTVRGDPEIPASSRQAIGEQATPQEEGEKEGLSLSNSPPGFHETEGQGDSNEEYFIDPNDVLKYTSAASVQNEPSVAETETQGNQAQRLSQEPMMSDVEPETRETHPSSPVEEFIDPSDVLKYAAASHTEKEPILGEQKAAAPTQESALPQRSVSPVPEPVVEQPSTAEPSTPADDSDFNPVLAPAKVSKKDKKKAKKKGKSQASLADYAPLDSSQNATDTEPLLAREIPREPSNEPSTELPSESKSFQPPSPKVPTATTEDEWTMPAKKSKKEKRKAKKSKGTSSPPLPPHEGDLMAGVEYFSPTEETGRGLHDKSLSLGHVQDAPPVVAEKATEADRSGLPKTESTAPIETVGGKGSHQHAETLRSGEAGAGLAEPVVETPFAHEDLRSTSGQQHLETDTKAREEGTRTPSRDVDFAATVAAGLEDAGLDANLVLNDPAFAERKSPPRSVGEADPEEVSIPKRPRKKKDAGAASPPVEQDKSSLPEDKLPGQDSAFDAALSSVLADPTFNRRTPSPDSAKEAVSDEFFPFQKRPKKKKAKKNAPVEDFPEAQEDLKDRGAPVNEQTSIQVDTARDSAPTSDPSTPFEEHMTEYFPVGAAHPAAIHVPPPPPLPNLGEYEPFQEPDREETKSEGLGLMGMRGLSSKSWADQMEEEEENMASSLDERKEGLGGGLETAAVGAAVVGAAGVAALRHRSGKEMKEVGRSGEASGIGKSPKSDASKSAHESPMFPGRPFSPPTQSKVSQLFPGLERVKRRTPSPRNFEQGVPERRGSPVKQDKNAVRLTQPIPSNWDTPGPVRDSAVTMNDTPPMVIDPFHDAGRDSGYHDDSRRESAHGAGHFLTPVPEVEAHQTEDPLPASSAQDQVAASPTESVTTTKQRSSALFQSSPGSTETPVEPQRLAEPAEVFPRQVTEPITAPPETTGPYVSIFGDGVPRSADNPPQSLTPPRMRSPQPLDTIREHSPEDSPLAKKGRPLSDVGMPEHGLKSMRRSDTEDTEVPRVLGEHHGPPKKIWSGKQPDKETGRARGASIGSDVAVLGGQRPSSAQSDRSAASKGEFGSIFARIKTPEMLSPAGSALSQRSATPPLRRINRAMSGDLRTASLLAEAKTSTRQKAQAAASSATTATAGPSTYDRVHDKGKGRALTMSEEYVRVLLALFTIAFY